MIWFSPFPSFVFEWSSDTLVLYLILSSVRCEDKPLLSGLQASTVMKNCGISSQPFTWKIRYFDFSTVGPFFSGFRGHRPNCDAGARTAKQVLVMAPKFNNFFSGPFFVFIFTKKVLPPVLKILKQHQETGQCHEIYLETSLVDVNPLD